jgi:hypothetical protein
MVVVGLKAHALTHRRYSSANDSLSLRYLMKAGGIAHANQRCKIFLAPTPFPPGNHAARHGDFGGISVSVGPKEPSQFATGVERGCPLSMIHVDNAAPPSLPRSVARP